MSGRRAKRLRRENKERLEQEAQEKAAIGVMDAAPELPVDMMVSYALTKFMSRSGYMYASLGAYRSLFMNDKYAYISALTYHQSFPERSVRGRYNDPGRKDIVQVAFKVSDRFQGLVIDRHGNVYLGDSTTPSSVEDVKKALVDGASSVRPNEGNDITPYFGYAKVNAIEFNEALEMERPLLEETMKSLQTKVEQSHADVELAKNFAGLKPEEAEVVTKACMDEFFARGYTEENNVTKDKDGKELTSEEKKALEFDILTTIKNRWTVDGKFTVPMPQAEESLPTEETPV